jgi:hypothetical protein
MADFTLAPVPGQTFLDNAGNIVPGGLIWTYESGTDTPAPTYTTQDGVAHTNPIVLDGFGRVPSEIYLTPGATQKWVFETAATPPAHGAVLRTYPTVAAVPQASSDQEVPGTAGEDFLAEEVAYLSDGSGSLTAGQWYKADANNAYSSTLPTLAFVVSAIAANESGTFRMGGSIALTGPLTPGAAYYVSGTAGQITATPPTNARRVGQADSVTSLVINPSINGGDFVGLDLIASGTVTTGSGAVGAVAVAVGAATVGLFSSGANALDFATAGVRALGIDSTRFIDSPTQPRCTAYNAATQNVTATAALALNTEEVDIGSMHDNSTNNSRITVPTGGDGFYLVIGSTTVDTESTGDANLALRLSGSTKLRETKLDATINDLQVQWELSWMGTLAAGAYVEMIIDKSDGSTWVFGSSSAFRSTRLSVVKLW